MREDRVSATKQHRNDPRIRRNEKHNGMSTAPVYIDQSIDQFIDMFHNNGVGSDVAPAVFCTTHLARLLIFISLCKYRTTTRLPSDLRPTTQECVHLLTPTHFRSRDKDGGYTIGTATPENSTLHANDVL